MSALHGTEELQDGGRDGRRDGSGMGGRGRRQPWFPDDGRKARKVRKAYGNGTPGEGRPMGEGRKYDPRACGAASRSADSGPRSE